MSAPAGCNANTAAAGAHREQQPRVVVPYRALIADMCVALAAHPELCLDGNTQRGAPELPEAQRVAQLVAAATSALAPAVSDSAAAAATAFLRAHGRLLRPADLELFAGKP
eukprot:SAG31_NODE_20849_length_564_cov_0.892473_1_plen_110_part_10